MPAAVAAGTFLHHLELTSTRPDALAAFYGRAMQMQVERLGGACLCRGPDRLLVIKQGSDNGLSFAAFACRDAAALAELRAHIERQRTPLLPSPSPLFDERAFAVRDPEGNGIIFGVAPAQPDTAPAGLRGPLQHVTVTSTDLAGMEGFYVEPSALPCPIACATRTAG